MRKAQKAVTLTEEGQEQAGQQAVGDTVEDQINAETEPVSKWEVVTDLSDGTTRVEAVNVPGRPGTGANDCFLRMINPATGEVQGFPIFQIGRFVSNGKLRA